MVYLYTTVCYVFPGCDLNIKTKHGYTALHQACICGHIEATQVLLAAGANANATDNKNAPPLICKCVKILFTHHWLYHVHYHWWGKRDGKRAEAIPSLPPDSSKMVYLAV